MWNGYVRFTKKAFDTVNHDLLLFKLQSMGFNKNAVNWMSSYLTGKEQIEIEMVLNQNPVG